MERRKYLIVSAAAIALLVLGAVVGNQLGDVASAQEGQPVEPMAVAGETETLLQYQGRLSDPGSAEAVADGSYTPSGGSPLWTETKDVPVNGGLFSTVLGDMASLNQALFDGRALWLGIKVGADAEAKPRQQVLPVAYALGLVPGAVVQGDSSSAVLRVNNAGSGRALETSGPVVVHGNLTVDGKLTGGSHTHSSHNNDASAHHKRYTDAEAASAAISHPEIVTQYEFEDHIYGGMHSNRALAYGVINGDGSVASATGNVSSRWNSFWQCFEITIDGHTYDHFSYVTVVTPITGGITSAFGLDGKLCVQIFIDSQSAPQKWPFQFVTFQP
jgi:hypothetical protein